MYAIGVWHFQLLTMGGVCPGHLESVFVLPQVYEAERAIASSNGHQVGLVWVSVQAVHGHTGAGSEGWEAEG